MTDDTKIAGTNGDTDFIDEIAELLPPEQRPVWYRDMAHLRRLPADDELLRIARAMGFLALITRQAPIEIASEREKLVATVQDAVSCIGALRHDTAMFHQEIENRLAQLPVEVAEGVNPRAVAAILAESLRQQFIQTGLPETTKALTFLARQSERAAVEFDCSSRLLIESCRNTTGEFQEALGNLRTMIQTTTKEAKQAAQTLTQAFLREYKWSVLTLCTIALMLGFSLGIAWHHWRAESAVNSPRTEVTVVPQLAPANPTSETASAPSRKRHGR